ncbi:MAG TPA: pilus assembly protein PilM [Thermogutta sp.]|nr:pilus assembly protein PilM [Thermogutta sp.]
MTGFSVFRRLSPIGMDIGHRRVRAVQLNGDRSAVVRAMEMEITASEADDSDRSALIAKIIREVLREGRFQCRNVVFAMSHPDLSVQNIRINDAPEKPLTESVLEEVAARANINQENVEIRCIDAGLVQQGEIQRREVVLLTCRKTAISERIQIANQAGIRLVGLDAEPAALARAVLQQYRRQSDRTQTMLLIRMGAEHTLVMILRGDQPLFAKYLNFGGHDLDQALVRQFQIPIESALVLRQGYGERRRDHRDPEVVRTVEECLEPLWNSWLEEIARCARYYQVTFRGQPIERVILAGSEATPELREKLESFLDLPTEVLDPFRAIRCHETVDAARDWDLAIGLALYSPATPCLV